mmetsp:Transcript_31147/g.41205  ORF Transcript_31147/g.41205 Transcript_31147/m.41205 type:complete len:430 (+) Transcript_31147:27-1316(+)
MKLTKDFLQFCWLLQILSGLCGVGSVVGENLDSLTRKTRTQLRQFQPTKHDISGIPLEPVSFPMSSQLKSTLMRGGKLKPDSEKTGFILVEAFEKLAQYFPFPLEVLGIFYGLAILVFGSRFRHQIHMMTLLRVSGSQMKSAGTKLKETYINTRRAIQKELPNLKQARRTLAFAKSELKDYKAILNETKKAKEDGIITEHEKRRIEKMKKVQMKELKVEIKRLSRATSSLQTIYESIEIDALKELVEGFAFWVGTVLTTGHSSDIIANVCGLYFHIFNLFKMLIDVTLRLDFPLTTALLKLNAPYDELEENKQKTVRIVSNGLVLALSSALLIFWGHIGYRLNSSLIASSLIVYSIEKIYEGVKKPSRSLKGRSGAIFMVILAAFGMCCRYYLDDHRMPDSFLKKMIFTPLHWIEEAVDEIVLLAEELG